ncbi:hypothetical protein EJ06DRAFT_520269 [Trichodelitschia bisporula]|uniref:Uncharacterized protein n=1 Tax=Trichodelitschia bisporula TaxID=703511 RepID=A0A6G1I1P5_9PEZI|nr:hypothetical protein EJ06DRAFT_520269 [Trichodelitschia bisporula]
MPRGAALDEEHWRAVAAIDCDDGGKILKAKIQREARHHIGEYDEEHRLMHAILQTTVRRSGRPLFATALDSGRASNWITSHVSGIKYQGYPGREEQKRQLFITIPPAFTDFVDANAIGVIHELLSLLRIVNLLDLKTPLHDRAFHTHEEKDFLKEQVDLEIEDEDFECFPSVLSLPFCHRKKRYGRELRVDGLGVAIVRD